MHYREELHQILKAKAASFCIVNKLFSFLINLSSNFFSLCWFVGKINGQKYGKKSPFRPKGKRRRKKLALQVSIFKHALRVINFFSLLFFFFSLLPVKKEKKFAAQICGPFIVKVFSPKSGNRTDHSVFSYFEHFCLRTTHTMLKVHGYVFKH